LPHRRTAVRERRAAREIRRRAHGRGDARRRRARLPCRPRRRPPGPGAAVPTDDRVPPDPALRHAVRRKRRHTVPERRGVPMTREPPRPHVGRVVRKEIEITADAARVYEAWADPERIATWFVDRAEGDM